MSIFAIQYNPGGHEYFCKLCKTIISVGYQTSYVKYCSNCGAPIDWEIIEENKEGGRNYNTSKEKRERK